MIGGLQATRVLLMMAPVTVSEVGVLAEVEVLQVGRKLN